MCCSLHAIRYAQIKSVATTTARIFRRMIKKPFYIDFNEK